MSDPDCDPKDEPEAIIVSIPLALVNNAFRLCPDLVKIVKVAMTGPAARRRQEKGPAPVTM